MGYLKMKYFIDEKQVMKREFWMQLDIISTEAQKKRLLDNNKILIEGISFQIVDEQLNTTKS